MTDDGRMLSRWDGWMTAEEFNKFSKKHNLNVRAVNGARIEDLFYDLMSELLQRIERLERGADA